MQPFLTRHRSEIEAACRRFKVRKLAAFGSVLRADFGPESDIDLLVTFEAHPGLDAFSQYFGFKETLEEVLGRSLDLVVADAIANPVFRAEVSRNQASLYEAA